MRDTDWFTTAVNEAKARVSQWPPELQQVASASLPSLEQQLAHEKHQADRIAELERENEALRKDAARYRWLSNSVLACDYGDNTAEKPSIGWHIRFDRITERNKGAPFIRGESIDAAIDAALKEQNKC